MPITYRPWTDSDDLSALTQLLHRAYQPLTDMGFRYTATWQDDTITAQRIAGGECWVAVDDSRTYLGTMTYYGPSSDKPKACAYYQRAGLATFGQFGVDPDSKGQGIGRELMAIVERRAREDLATEIACDTAEGATHLIAMYERWGYRVVDRVDWEGTNYVSVVLAKELG